MMEILVNILPSPWKHTDNLINFLFTKIVTQTRRNGVLCGLPLIGCMMPSRTVVNMSSNTSDGLFNVRALIRDPTESMSPSAPRLGRQSSLLYIHVNPILLSISTSRNIFTTNSTMSLSIGRHLSINQSIGRSSDRWINQFIVYSSTFYSRALVNFT